MALRTRRGTSDTESPCRSSAACVLEDASSMLACAVETTKEIKIMSGDEHLCHMPEMTEIESVWPLCIRDGVSLDHLRHGHIDVDPACSTCYMIEMRHSQHRRQLEPLCPGQLSGDVAGPLPKALNNEKYFFVCVKRNTRMVLVACMKDKRSETVRDVLNDFTIDLRTRTAELNSSNTCTNGQKKRNFDLALNAQKPMWA